MAHTESEKGTVRSLLPNVLTVRLSDADYSAIAAIGAANGVKPGTQGRIAIQEFLRQYEEHAA